MKLNVASKANNTVYEGKVNVHLFRGQYPVMKAVLEKKITLWCTSLEGREGEERGGERRGLPQIYQPNGSLDVYYHKPNESITF